VSGPIILVDSSDVVEGKLHELKARMTELADFVAGSGTRAQAYNMYLSTDGALMTVVQSHPDSDSAEEQMAAAAHIFAGFAPLLRMRALDIYGDPSPALMARLERKAELLGLAGPPRVHSLHAGFSRL
jgi:hypothetical protein